MIELSKYDFYIKDITLEDGTTREVANLRNGLAFNEEFIQTLKDEGVKKYIFQEEEDSEPAKS